MSLIVMVEKEMFHNVMLQCAQTNASADVSGPPNALSVSKSLIHPLFIASLAIFLIMQALCL